MTQAPGMMIDECITARQSVYRFLRAALELPSTVQHCWMRSEDFSSALETIATAFGVDFIGGEQTPENWADHESRYLACFEVGMPSPPVPLLASHYQKREPAPRIIHEHILFYRSFGLAAPDRQQAPADHLVYQLDYLIYLDKLLQQQRFDPDSIYWARIDFISRHMQRWTADANREAQEKCLPKVYRTLLAVLAAAVVDDQKQTVAMRQTTRVP